MATAAPNQNLPLFYNAVEPLNVTQHGKMKVRKLLNMSQMAKAHAILEFCEQFEAAGQRTAAFMEDLLKSNLLMDGEVAIQPEGFDQPFVYRGFRMIDEEKLRDVRGDELRKLNQNGMLPLLYAHL